MFWQTDENDQPAIVTEPYEKAFTAANVAKEQEFYCREPLDEAGDSFGVRRQAKRDAAGSNAHRWESAVAAALCRRTPKFRRTQVQRAREGGMGKDRHPDLAAKDNASRKFKAAFGDAEEILSVEWTHRHYVQDDEYIPYGEDIEAFLKREIAKPIIRWQDSPQLGYEILPNKYFYRYQPPTPAKDLLAEFWKLEKEAEGMLQGVNT